MSLRIEIQRIPTGAKIVAAVALAAVAIFFYLTVGSEAGTLVGCLAGMYIAGVILLAGYVYADAKRRGMPAIPWTALAILVPNALGFVIYFLLRKPIVHPCGGCGTGVAPDAAFCPKCGQSQMAA